MSRPTIKKTRSAVSNPDGLCNQCRPYAGSATIDLCPLHTSAEALRAELADVIEVLRLQAPDLYEALDDARALLAATQKGA